MTKGLFERLISPTSVIDECRAETLEMIHNTQEMFVFVERALHDAESEHVKSRVKTMDLEVNRLQRSVRRKIYQHLVLSKGKDLLSSLQLHDIVNEIERVGDYSKNIAELAEMIPQGVNWGAYDEGMTTARTQLLEMFDCTFRTVEGNDKTHGRKCDDLYHQIARFCDATLGKVVTAPRDGDARVDRTALALALMLRYMKRVAAHLRNTVQTIMDPYTRIGYQG
jgi:phosphate uptake regulator